jgi:hypothetical protein
MKTPRPVGSPSKPPPSRATYAKLAIIAASATFVTARLVDVALISTGVAAAAGSAVFAGVMIMEGDHAPRVNGMQFLSVFAAPKGSPKPTAASTEVAQSGAGSGVDVDPSPLGSIAPPTTTDPSEYILVAARTDRAWVRAGTRIFPVHPGDTLPNLGKVAAIVWGDGHWTLVDEKGEALLTSGDGGDSKNQKGPYAKPMILNDGPE